MEVTLLRLIVLPRLLPCGDPPAPVGILHLSAHVSAGLGAKYAIGAAETAHLKKFGKLLATFGTRMACLLRHLGQECSPRERQEAYRLYAKARCTGRHFFWHRSSCHVSCRGFFVASYFWFCFLAACFECFDPFVIVYLTLHNTTSTSFLRSEQ